MNECSSFFPVKKIRMLNTKLEKNEFIRGGTNSSSKLVLDKRLGEKDVPDSYKQNECTLIGSLSTTRAALGMLI